mgnify:CR=1 FL=1
MKIAVVGSGIRGLSAAYFLSKKGYDVTIIEKDKCLGGVCQKIKIGGTETTIYYHLLMSSDKEFIDFLENLGLKDKLITKQLSMGFYYENNLYPLNKPIDFIKFKPIFLFNKIRLLYSLFYSKIHSNKWKNYENQTALNFIKKIAGEQNTEIIWEPLLKAKFGSAYNKISAVDLIARLSRMSGDGKVKTKCVYGIQNLISSVIEKCEEIFIKKGIEIKKNSFIKNIDSENNNVVIEYSDGSKEKFDKVLLMIPEPEISKLIDKNKYEKFYTKLNGIKYLKNVTIILNTNKPICKYYMLNISDTEIPITGLIGFSNVYGTEQFGNTYIYYLTNYFEESEIYEYSDKEVFNIYIPSLKKINSEFNESWIIDYKVVRYPYADVLRDLNFFDKLLPNETPIKNLYMCTAAQTYPEMSVLNSSVKQIKNGIEQYF